MQAAKTSPIKASMDLRNYFLAEVVNPSECYQCGTCTATCPLNEYRPDKLTIRKLFHQAQLGIMPDYLVWECTTCKECEVRCPREVQITDSVITLRKYAFKNRMIPPDLEKMLWNVLEEANPMGESKSQRGQWAAGLNLKNALDGTKNLLYVGDANSYDRRLQPVARKFSEILQHLKIDFGILGDKELTSGESIQVVGETGYLDILIQKNVELFNQTGASRIITISPHDYDFFKKVYPSYGLEAEVLHYTEFLDEVINKNQLEFKGEVKTEVTYHDPCYLGRYHQLFDPPRMILEEIPGLELVEMKNSKNTATCCGGGGGQMFMEMNPGERLSDKRVLEAKSTEASALITSCPFCIQNFEDSTKVTNANLPVNDVIELVYRALRNNK